MEEGKSCQDAPESYAGWRETAEGESEEDCRQNMEKSIGSDEDEGREIVGIEKESKENFEYGKTESKDHE